MGNFDAHKWFKKEYLGEGHTKDKMERDQAIRRFDQLTDDDKLKLAKIQAMMDRERSLREDGLNEASITMDAFNRMESMVDRETYKKFIDSLDDLLDDWYMEGFDKNDVVAFMEVIIPSGPTD
jgi:hypothetical protein